MSKQINLALAAAGDVAVLRNETRYKIMHKERSDLSPYFPVRILFEGINVHATYSDNGNFCRNIQSPTDIIDVLRNGASIFEQIQNQ